MLVLSRKSNQSLVIGDSVVVTVVEIGDDFVRLTIETPNEAEIQGRYPQALDLPRTDPGRPIVVTLSLHHGAILDRLRRQMCDDESTPPSRDAALSALLDAVADHDEFPLPQIGSKSG